ncbi:MAG: butyrate kinase [Candidatus Muiribacterium halophilum]|uniref:Probable butyrate kinase n=1 Tax=Muiribacterium halophilum TaxID=2053465 RepID=A0A2N5ZBZ2_MUIH1|nr:MAG: butyrate kinase [Candidatus Muirbacterium halophilum]
MKILAINPGSTSTKMGIFEDDKITFEHTIRHNKDELKDFEKAIEQKEFRSEAIKAFLNENDIKLSDFAAIAGRGAPIKSLESGIYRVNEKMLHDLYHEVKADHPSILGAIIANDIAKDAKVPAFIVDPVSVDEFEEVARISGIPEIPRVSLSHALNMKAVAKRFERDENMIYEDNNLIICHLGGGFSITAHKKGKMIDVNNANDDGPFSPERSGGLPSGQLAKICYSGKYSNARELLNYLTKKAGVSAYLDSNNISELVKRMNEPEVKRILDAMIYQIAKEIGKMATVLKGNVNYIVITGGIAYNKCLMDDIADYTEWIAPIKVYPGEDELLALSEGVKGVLEGKREEKEYV